MDKKRIFRALVCFLLVCVFLINISPIRIRVEATAVDPVSVGAAAILMWFIGTYMGVVVNPTTANLNSLWNTIQVDVPPAIYSYYDDEEAAAAAMDDWQRAMYNFDFSIYDDDDFDEPDDSDPGDSSEEVFDAEKSKWGFGFNKSNTIAIGAELGAFLVDWFANAIEQGAFEVVTAEAPEGYAYYNGMELPEIPAAPAGYSNITILSANNGDAFRCYYTPEPAFADSSFGKNLLRMADYLDEPYPYYRCYLSSGKWSDVAPLEIPSGGIVFKGAESSQTGLTYVWANYDLKHIEGNHVVLSGSAPTSKATSFIEPDMYFGDYPDRIKDGAFDEDSVKMPVFDFSRLMETSAYAQEAARSMYNQINNGDMAYNDYVDQIKASDAVVDPDAGIPDASVPVVDPSNPEDIGPIGDYALDLTEFFPFCIPYDIKEFLSLLSAAPEAPVFEWDIVVKSWDWGFHVTVDLSPWNDVAALFRKLELLAFIVGLGFVTREKFLRG